MEYVSDFMFEMGFDLDMLGDAKKYLERWRMENKEQSDWMESECKARNQEKVLEKEQQLERREAHKEQIKDLAQILQNQSLASAPKAFQNKVAEKVLQAQEPEEEEEEDAWNSLGASLSTQQSEKPTLDPLKKKRTYTKKGTKNEKMKGSTGQAFNENQK